MNKVLINNEQDLLGFISLPEVKLSSFKFIFNDNCQQIDLELFFDSGKGLLCGNVRQPQINENFNYGLIGTQCFLSVNDISGSGMEHCRWSVEDYEEGSIRFYCENIWKIL